MVVKINSKHEVTLPKRVLEALGVGPGDQLELNEGSDGFTIQPRRIDYSRLGTLRSKTPPGDPPFDIESFRNQAHDSAFRD